MPSKDNKKKLLVGGLLLGGAAVAYMATRNNAPPVENGPLNLQLWDEDGNLIGSNAGRLSGRISASSAIIPNPGNYTITGTIKNDTTTNGLPVGATLGLKIIFPTGYTGGISGIVTGAYANGAIVDTAYGAGNTPGGTVGFVISLNATEAMVGTSGTLQFQVLAPEAAGRRVLKEDSMALTVAVSAFQVVSLTPVRWHSTKGDAAPGTSVPLTVGNVCWTNHTLVYKGAGGNFRFYSDVYIGTSYFRSVKDFTIPFAATNTSYTIITGQQATPATITGTSGDPGTGYKAQTTLVYAGTGTDTSQAVVKSGPTDNNNVYFNANYPTPVVTAVQANVTNPLNQAEPVRPDVIGTSFDIAWSSAVQFKVFGSWYYDWSSGTPSCYLSLASTTLAFTPVGNGSSSVAVGGLGAYRFDINAIINLISAINTITHTVTAKLSYTVPPGTLMDSKTFTMRILDYTVYGATIVLNQPA
jgi:hypothetical protein